MSVCAIVGSSFAAEGPAGLELEPRGVETPWGEHTLYRAGDAAFLAFRHGLPHRYLPHQIPYRAQAWALREVGCEALLVSSSVGVLDSSLPLDQPLLLGDLLMPDNRLPDGSACTVFPEPTAEQGHLVLGEGLFSRALTEQLAGFAEAAGYAPARDVVFGYAPGPRTKTPAENRLWRSWGAQVNSMTLGPEVVLAAELGIPVAGLAVGHKLSGEAASAPRDASEVGASLARCRAALGELVRAFLTQAQTVPSGNHLYRFGESS